jgi:hypothetical protein
MPDVPGFAVKPHRFILIDLVHIDSASSNPRIEGIFPIKPAETASSASETSFIYYTDGRYKKNIQNHAFVVNAERRFYGISFDF